MISIGSKHDKNTKFVMIVLVANLLFRFLLSISLLVSTVISLLNNLTIKTYELIVIRMKGSIVTMIIFTTKYSKSEFCFSKVDSVKFNFSSLFSSYSITDALNVSQVTDML
jgi:hypothetical protein